MQIPQKIGKYEIIERIGRGGMGYVYKAVDPILKRDVALKCMLKDIADDPDLRNRFLREAQSAGGLRHPNIVTIYDVGEDTNRCPYIAMEFLTGTDLEHLIKNDTGLTLSQKLEIIIQTCRGLGYAHSKGIIHRDMKPANIRLLENGEIKIMDFGIAKIAASHFTRTGMVMGTPHYMSPEQIRGEKVDGRADIFSMGIVLYELLVGRKPFPGDNATSVLFRIIHTQPEPLSDAKFQPPEGLETIVLRAMAKNIEKRYQTCEEFNSDLTRIHNLVQPPDPFAQATVGNSNFVSPSPTPRPAIRRTPVTPLPRTPTPPPVQPANTIPDPTDIELSSPTVIQRMEPAAQIPSQTMLPPLPSATAPPLPWLSQKWLIAGSFIVVGMIVIAVVAFKFFATADHQDLSITNSGNTLVKAPAAIQPLQNKQVIEAQSPRNGWISLNIQPWATIQSIKNAKGESISPPLQITPCKFPIEEGTYEITLVNSKYLPAVVRVEVKENEIAVVNRSLEGFDTSAAIDSLGL